MSEYQYYEFLALDRPLTAKQRAELRSISSRAEITATRFTNEYQWGDLRGDPLQMVKEYFDAFLYLANWGTRQVMFRLPRGAGSGDRQAVLLHGHRVAHRNRRPPDPQLERRPGGSGRLLGRTRRPARGHGPGPFRARRRGPAAAVPGLATGPAVGFCGRRGHGAVGAARAEEPERRSSGGGGFLRDRREPHRRGGSFEPGDRGAWRAGGMDRSGGAGADGGGAAGGGRGPQGGAGEGGGTAAAQGGGPQGGS